MHRHRAGRPAAAGLSRRDLRAAASASTSRPSTPTGAPVVGELGELVITRADAVDAGRVLGRRRRQPLPRGVLRATTRASGATATGSRSPSAGAASSRGARTRRSTAAACGSGTGEFYAVVEELRRGPRQPRRAPRGPRGRAGRADAVRRAAPTASPRRRAARAHRARPCAARSRPATCPTTCDAVPADPADADRQEARAAGQAHPARRAAGRRRRAATRSPSRPRSTRSWPATGRKSLSTVDSGYGRQVDGSTRSPVSRKALLVLALLVLAPLPFVLRAVAATPASIEPFFRLPDASTGGGGCNGPAVQPGSPAGPGRPVCAPPPPVIPPATPSGPLAGKVIAFTSALDLVPGNDGGGDGLRGGIYVVGADGLGAAQDRHLRDAAAERRRAHLPGARRSPADLARRQADRVDVEPRRHDAGRCPSGRINWDIWVADINGANAQRLTTNAGRRHRAHVVAGRIEDLLGDRHRSVLRRGRPRHLADEPRRVGEGAGHRRVAVRSSSRTSRPTEPTGRVHPRSTAGSPSGATRSSCDGSPRPPRRG